jgi:hypothetical protein
MIFPAAKPGLVIRYSFLWSYEKDAGSLHQAVGSHPQTVAEFFPNAA